MKKNRARFLTHTLMTQAFLMSLFLLNAALPAQALEVTAVGGINFSAPDYSEATVKRNTTGNSGLTYGLLASFPLIFLKLDIETGLTISSQKSAYEVAAGNTQQSREIQMTEAHIPLLLRYRIDPLVGIGVGGYYGKTLQGRLANVSESEIGMLFNIHALMPLAHSFFLTFDGRFLYGMQDRSERPTLTNYKTRIIQGLVGFTYFIDLRSDESSTGPSGQIPTNPARSSR